MQINQKKYFSTKQFDFSEKYRTFVNLFFSSTMENTPQQLTDEFRAKLERLIFLYENTKKRVETLEDELATANEKLMDAHKEIVELRADYKNLKMARMVGFTEEDKKKAYRRISNLVREIDTCLELLND